MAVHLRGVGVSLALFVGLSTLCWSLHRTNGQEPVNQNAAPAANQAPSQRAQTAYPGVPDHVRPQASDRFLHRPAGQTAAGGGAVGHLKHPRRDRRVGAGTAQAGS